MKRPVYLSLYRCIAAILLAAVCLLAVGCRSGADTDTDGKLQIVTGNFPAYDFARTVAGDRAEVTMLLPTGAESHGFEPTLDDIRAIKYCDLFVFTGGVSDVWAEEALASLNTEVNALRMMDCVTALEQEPVDGTDHDHDHDHSHDHEQAEYDEHVWTSPANAAVIAGAIAEQLAAIDPENAEQYRSRLSAFQAELETLSNDFRTLFANKDIPLIFGDRFPFRYFTEEFGVTYYAAFPGCSRETEPSLATMDMLVDKIREQDVSTVFYIEFSNRQIADKLASLTGVATAQLHSCQAISAEQLEDGETYLSLMRKNLTTLEEAFADVPDLL